MKNPLTKKKKRSLKELQLYAATIFGSMADYHDFHVHLCSSGVLNFLCIALNQLEEIEETVTLTFKKLSRYPVNLVAM